MFFMINILPNKRCVGTASMYSAKDWKSAPAGDNKVNRDLLDPPTKKGNAPTFKKDGKSVEIHHEGQDPNVSYKEMHPQEHRGKGNDAVNPLSLEMR